MLLTRSKLNLPLKAKMTSQMVINGQDCISKWEVVQGATDRVNIPCLMHDT